MFERIKNWFKKKEVEPPPIIEVPEPEQDVAYRYGISFQFIPEHQLVDIQIISPPLDGRSPEEIDYQAHQLAEIITNVNNGNFENLVYMKLAKIVEDHPEHKEYVETIINSIGVMKKFKKTHGAIRPRDVFRNQDQPLPNPFSF